MSTPRTPTFAESRLGETTKLLEALAKLLVEIGVVLERRGSVAGRSAHRALLNRVAEHLRSEVAALEGLIPWMVGPLAHSVTVAMHGAVTGVMDTAGEPGAKMLEPASKR